ncbi:MAG: hypothetical protein OXC07_06170 [Kistimonas sp.]|nr:hypothetical protein [Kistimonas sp.]
MIPSSPGHSSPVVPEQETASVRQPLVGAGATACPEAEQPGWIPAAQDREETSAHVISWDNHLAVRRGHEALQRLSLLPFELQSLVLRYLPLADILVWHKVSRFFHDRITAAGLREQCVRRSLGRAFPGAAFTRENYTQLLRPWLSGFTGNPLSHDWPGALFRSDILFCAVTRTLRNSQCLVLKGNGNFSFPGLLPEETRFSPDGRYLVVKGFFHAEGGGLTSRHYRLLERKGLGWRQSPLVDEQGAYFIDFAADSNRVAICFKEKADVLLWEKATQDPSGWQQLASLGSERPAGRITKLVLSAWGAALAVQYANGELWVWHRHAARGWRCPDAFCTTTASIQGNRTAFSPDERWLLLVSCNLHQFSLYGRNEEGGWSLPVSVDIQASARPELALFRQYRNQLELFVLLKNGLLVPFELKDGHWFAQGHLQHSETITDICFSPDGQHLVTQCARSNAVLWEQNPSHLWVPLQVLNQALPRTHSLQSLCFDPGSRWLIARNSYSLYYGDTREMWIKDSAGRWQHSPAGEEGPLATCWGLAAGRNGQHLMALNASTPADQNVFSLLELRGDTWVTRAQASVPFVCGQNIAVDPFCHSLAVICLAQSGHHSVEILSVQEGAVEPHTLTEGLPA